MTDAELNEIVTAWVAGSNAEEGSPAYQENWWAISEVIDWSLFREGERLWQFVLAAYQRDLTDKVIAILSAGPLEDLLVNHGAEFIDRVEELARNDSKFNWLLGGVWGKRMSEDVWERVRSVRNHVW